MIEVRFTSSKDFYGSDQIQR